MKTDRRTFLKTSAAAVASTAILTRPLKSFAREVTPSLSKSQIMVGIGNSPAGNIRRAIKAMGGIERFVKPGDRVFLKPNSISDGGPQMAVNTHPEVVREVARLCADAGASEIVAGMRDGISAAKGNGILKALEENGGRVLCTTKPSDYKEITLNRGVLLRRVNAMKLLMEFDVFINIPVAKHHAGSQLTMGLKNYMGLIPRADAVNMHRLSLDQTIADLATVRKADLTVVDATRILLSNGPSGPGPTKQIDRVFVSDDPLAADAYAASLFDLEPRTVRHLQAGYDSGLGQIDVDMMVIAELRG